MRAVPFKKFKGEDVLPQLFKPPPSGILFFCRVQSPYRTGIILGPPTYNFFCIHSIAGGPKILPTPGIRIISRPPAPGIGKI